MNLTRPVFLSIGVALLVACAGDDDAADTAATEPTEATAPDTDGGETPEESAVTTTPDPDDSLLAVTTVDKTGGELSSGDVSSPTPVYEEGNIDTGLQPFIDQAVDDLAARLEVDAEVISVHSAVLVVWSDAGLGCPEPDRFYAQVPADGSAIELRHDDLYYRYHSGGQQGPFLCEYPLAETPPRSDLDGASGADT